MKKKALVAVFLMVVLSIQTVLAGGWTQTGDNWQYIQADGEAVYDAQKRIDGTWYYFDAEGNMVRDKVVQIGDDYYYFDAEGKRVSGDWRKAADPEDGEVYWYYLQSTGKAAKNKWLTLDGKRYHFTGPHMDSGWYTDEDGDTYFLNGKDEGWAESGWLPYKGDDEKDVEGKMSIGWYYFDPATYKMVRETEKKINKTWYAFTEDGLMVGGFAYVQNSNPISLADLYIVKYFDELTGARVNGWKYVEESDTDAHVQREEGWYYMKNGVPYSAYSGTKMVNLTTGVVKIDGSYYAFDTNGKMVKGLILSESDYGEENNLYYYFGDDGKMQTGYVDIVEGNEIAPADKMYFETKGTVIPYHGASVTGVRGGKVYDNGVLRTAERDRFEKIQISDDRTYIVNAQGAMQREGAVLTLETGRKMKVVLEGENYNWVQINQ